VHEAGGEQEQKQQQQEQKQQQEQQQEQQQQPEAKKRRLGVRELAYTVIRSPHDPRAVHRVLPLLEALMRAEALSNKHWR
jgi:multidrug resistance efflux pump